MVSVSCNNDDDDNYNDNYGDTALVGIWELIESGDGFAISVTVTFNENLSGTLATSETFDGETEAEFQNFKWSTEGNKLRLKLDGDTEKLTYSISGDMLTVTDDDGETTVLTRQ